MTTQELKNKIEKVLGNSIRCLLPSYWWKNLFHSVADRIDEVEQSASEMAEASKMPIVASEKELNKLDLPKGSVAAVEEVGNASTIDLNECYMSSAANALNDWDKLTRVKNIEKKANESEGVVVIGIATPRGKDEYIAIQCYKGSCNYLLHKGNTTRVLTLQGVNNILIEEDCRIFTIAPISGADSYFTFYSEIPTTELYIKGDSWERLAKEGDITGDGGSTSGDGLTFGKERYAYVSKHADVNGNIAELELSEEQKAYNQETNEMLKSGEKVYLSYKGTFWKQVGYSASNSNYTFYFSTASMFLPNDNRVFGEFIALSSDGEIALADTLVGGSSSDITVDSAMSSTSTNPVQNKVVYSELQKKQSTISDLADIRNNAAKGATALQSVPSEYITESELIAKNYATTLQVNTKQDKIDDLATIRSGAALGKTALQQADIADLATKGDITNLTNEIITNERIHVAALNDLNDRINNISGGSSIEGGVVPFYAVVDGGELSEDYKSKNVSAFNSYRFGQSITVIGIAGGAEVSTLFPMSVAYQENADGLSGLSFIACNFPMTTASGANAAILFYEDGSVMVQL